MSDKYLNGLSSKYLSNILTNYFLMQIDGVGNGQNEMDQFL